MGTWSAQWHVPQGDRSPGIRWSVGALTGLQSTQGQAAPLGLASGAFWAPGRNQGRNLALKTLPGPCSQGQGDSSPLFLKKRVTCLVSQRLSAPLPSPRSRVQSWGSHHPPRLPLDPKQPLGGLHLPRGTSVLCIPPDVKATGQSSIPSPSASLRLPEPTLEGLLSECVFFQLHSTPPLPCC